jgi:alkylated DNA repair dioxygenase AlkB
MISLLDDGSSAFLEMDVNDMSVVIYNSVLEIQNLLLERPPIVVMGRECRQQRDVGFFSDESIGYKYSGNIMNSIPLGENLKTLLYHVNCRFGTSYNGILINRYNDGNNCIGAHSDEERNLDSNLGVFMISVGAERKFRIRKKKGVFDDGSNFKDFKTKSYHCYIMSGQFQKNYTHEIPIEKKITEPRISFTFRKHTE